MPEINKGKLFCCGPFFFVLAAFILSQVASKQCHYVSVPSGSYLNQRFLVSDLGMWCYRTTGGRNVQYNEDDRWETDFGSKGNAVRGLSVATTVIGAIVIIVDAFVPCCGGDRCGGPKTNALLGLLLLVNCILEGCTFLFLQSDPCTCAEGCACSLGTGGNCGIAACVLWFVSAVLTCGLAKADPGEEEGEG